MPYTKGRKLTKTETDDLVLDIRDLAIQQMSDTLLSMGISQPEVDKAAQASRDQNSDKPLADLGMTVLRKRMPGLLK